MLYFLFSVLHFLSQDVDIKGEFIFNEQSPDYYLLQYSLTPQQFKNILTENGFLVKGYIPDNGFVVYGKLNKERLKKIGAEGVIPYSFIPKYSKDIIEPGIDSFKILLFEESDISLVEKEIERMGFKIIDVSESKWNKILMVKGYTQYLDRLSSIKWVRWIEPYRVPVLHNNECQWVLQTWEEEKRRIWDKGLTGEEVIVSTSDSGIYTDHNMFRDPEIPIETWGDYPEHRKIIAYKQGSSQATFGDAAGSSYHGTHTGGTIAGNDEYVGGDAPYDGMAKDAKMYFVDIGRGGSRVYPPADLNDLYIMPYEGNEAGRAVLISNSWGWSSFAGGYNIEAYQTDQFMWNHKDFLVFFSAGNDDPKVTPPGTAKNIVTVGATYNGSNADMVTGFSDPGPTNDGRIKPTVVAPGILTSAYGGAPDNYLSMPGTSMSSPAAAGAVALIYEYLHEGWYPGGVPDKEESINPSAALLKAMAIASTVPLSSYYLTPSNKGGWGRVCLDSVLYFPDDKRKLFIEDDTLGINTGDERSFEIEVSSLLPLKIVLVWTDYPPELSASKQLVNDLDLEVTSPSGAVYYGNNFKNGYSVEGEEPDQVNVEEVVWIEYPEEGRWIINVKGKNVPFGPQPFALVVTGDLNFGVRGSLTYHAYEVVDTLEGGNKNGMLDPGETAVLNLIVENPSSEKVYALLGEIKSKDNKVIVKDTFSYFENVPPFSFGKSIPGFKVKAKNNLTKGEKVEFAVELYEYGEYFTTVEFGVFISTGVQESSQTIKLKKLKSFGSILQILKKLQPYYSSIKVYSASGRLLKIFRDGEKIQKFSLPQGVYFIQLREEKKERIIKFINIP